MARPGKREESLDFVESSLSYLVDTGEKPVSHSNAHGAAPVQHTGKYEDRPAAIHNGRLIRERLSLASTILPRWIRLSSNC
jgi:hypothetical protein